MNINLSREITFMFLQYFSQNYLTNETQFCILPFFYYVLRENTVYWTQTYSLRDSEIHIYIYLILIFYLHFICCTQV